MASGWAQRCSRGHWRRAKCGNHRLSPHTTAATAINRGTKQSCRGAVLAVAPPWAVDGRQGQGRQQGSVARHEKHTPTTAHAHANNGGVGGKGTQGETTVLIGTLC